MIEKVRRGQLRDFTNWIVFAVYLDTLRKDNTKQNLNKILKLSNIKELNTLDNKYIDELLEKDRNRKNQKYKFANDKIKELKQLKRMNIIENEIRYKDFRNICLRLETQNIK